MLTFVAFVTAIFVSVHCTAAGSLSGADSISASSLKDWRDYKVKYNKSYSSMSEDQIHLKLFLQALVEITQNNQNPLSTFKMDLNQFSDLTLKEYSSLLGYRGDDNSSRALDYTEESASTILSRQSAPESKNWRDEGAVTEVKDQGRCGSCWSFASAGALESHTFIASEKLAGLSEQNLLDCAPNGGCDRGGRMDNAFQYIQENEGINSEESYPYEGKKLQCRHNPDDKAATLSGFGRVKRGDERHLMELVGTVGPVAVAVHTNRNFGRYKSGVYYDRSCPSGQMNHAVLVVGYGNENGQDYWLVKNSWGKRWGDGGYIKMARNKNNHCGIASDAVYPQV